MRVTERVLRSPCSTFQHSAPLFWDSQFSYSRTGGGVEASAYTSSIQIQIHILWYTHVNSGSLPCAPRCGDPLYHMLETPTFPSTVLSTL